MAITGFNRPGADGREMYDYLCKLSEWLNYMFANIDESNMTETFVSALEGLNTAGSETAARIEEVAQAVALINKKLNDIQARLEILENEEV